MSNLTVLFLYWWTIYSVMLPCQLSTALKRSGGITKPFLYRGISNSSPSRRLCRLLSWACITVFCFVSIFTWNYFKYFDTNFIAPGCWIRSSFVDLRFIQVVFNRNCLSIAVRSALLETSLTTISSTLRSQRSTIGVCFQSRPPRFV